MKRKERNHHTYYHPSAKYHVSRTDAQNITIIKRVGIGKSWLPCAVSSAHGENGRELEGLQRTRVQVRDVVVASQLQKGKRRENVRITGRHIVLWSPRPSLAINSSCSGVDLTYFMIRDGGKERQIKREKETEKRRTSGQRTSSVKSLLIRRVYLWMAYSVGVMLQRRYTHVTPSVTASKSNTYPGVRTRT